MKLLNHLPLLLLAFTLTACGGSETAEVQREETPMEENLNESDIYVDRSFFGTYANQTMQLMAMSAVAAERAESPEVRSFADSLRRAHQQIFAAMESLTKEYNIETPASMDEPYQRELETMKAMKGENFDQVYLNNVIAYHDSLDEQARNIIEESEIDAFVDFGRRISSHQYRHRRTAEALLDNLDV